MDTRISAGLFELTLPGVWARTAPEPGLTVFRSATGAEQISISSLKTPQPLSDADRRDKLRDVVRVRQEAESRQCATSGQQVTFSATTVHELPHRAEFTSANLTADRRTATLIVARTEGFVVLYLEAVGPDAASFDALAARLFGACRQT
jgi:hypothetical protein